MVPLPMSASIESAGEELSCQNQPDTTTLSTTATVNSRVLLIIALRGQLFSQLQQLGVELFIQLGKLILLHQYIVQNLLGGQRVSQYHTKHYRFLALVFCRR